MNVLALDANALFARSYFAAQRLSPDPREAITLAVNTMSLLLNPETNKIGLYFDKTLFAWDGQQNAAKGREAKPPIYHETKAALMGVFEYLFSTVNVEHPEAEGDDIVATAVAAAKNADCVFVVSSDKDLMQLQGGNCQYYSLHDKAVLSTSYITRKFHGIKHPAQVAIELAIVGDGVDNIKGIHRYGEVKCRSLFKAVTPEMSFDEALEAIRAQLPAQQLAEFNAAFKRTLLRSDLDGIPAPADLRLLPSRDVQVLDLPQIEQNYERLQRAYR